MVDAGLDWAGKGWIAVVHDGEGTTAGFYPTILNFWHDNDVDRALVDIPVGLADDRERVCDRNAAAYLGDGASSVFKTPVREAVYAENIERAKEIHEENNVGFSIQNQAWGIVPRIREVDVFLQRHGVGRTVREAHPEVCFAALDGGQVVDEAKQSEAGREARLEILGDRAPWWDGADDAEGFLRDTERRLMEPSYAPVVGRSARDDVVDAMVLAVAAAGNSSRWAATSVTRNWGAR